MKRLIVMGLIIVPLYIAGCANDNAVNVYDNQPAAPTGLLSITGDNSVYLTWYGVDENDIDGYIIYRNETSPDINANFQRIAEVRYDVYEYTDYNVDNGATYYYRIKAIDGSGQRSDYSNYAMDTPRPEGHNVVIYDYHDGAHYTHTGFDLYAGQRVPYDSLESCDIYLDYDTGIPGFFITVRHSDYYIQDFGFAANFDEVGYSPDSGWSHLGYVEAIEGHIYLLKLWHFSEWHYAKIRVDDLTSNPYAMQFSWAYQTDPGNRELKIRPGIAKHAAADVATIK
jgi:hypothetical protein